MRYSRLMLIIVCAVCLTPAAMANPQPRLVIVISIDQFPYEYLTRFSPYFGDKGFRLLIDDGASFVNAQYEHAFNMTGSSHAVIGTGCYGNVNGIVSNSWYDPSTGKNVYCAQDERASTLGADTPGRSPANLLVSTIGDELRLFSGFRSRIVSISQKDRSAILMGGRFANAAYWLADSSFVTSDYYMHELPDWVKKFNGRGMASSYFGKTWNRVLPVEAYRGMDRDDAPYEDGSNGLGLSFPHRITGGDTTRITPSYFEALWNSPFLNELLLAFVKEAVLAESLGTRGATDMLFIGISANDAVGHAFGPYSHEVMDMTIQTDRLLADFFGFLDQNIGLEHCLLVLTSDHGIAPIPEYLTSRYPRFKAGRIGSGMVLEECDRIMSAMHGKKGKKESWVEKVINGNIYLRRSRLAAGGIDPNRAVARLADSLRNGDLIAGLLTEEEVISGRESTRIEARLRRSYYPSRSGDIVYALHPYFIDYAGTSGTDHGQPYSYDAHVPLLISGAGIRHGVFYSKASPADIAPTLAALLGTGIPTGSEGRILDEALESR